MSLSKNGAFVYMMISDRVPFDRPQKVVLLINRALPDDASRVRFTGCNSGKSITVDAEKHGSRALIVLTPAFFHPEPCRVAVVSCVTDKDVCEYQQKFLFTSKLMRLRELFAQVLDPVDFMCAACHVSPHRLDVLDSELERVFKEKQPVCFDLLNGYVGNDYEEDYHSCEEFPTLLHFAARYGLWKLCYTLIKCHGGHKALSTPNKDGLEPHMLAQKYGHEALFCALEETRTNVSSSSVSTDEGIYEAFESQYDSPQSIYNDLTSLKQEDPYEIMKDPNDQYVPLSDLKKNAMDDPVVIEEIVSRLQSILLLPESQVKENLQFVVLYAQTKLKDIGGAGEPDYVPMKKEEPDLYQNVNRGENKPHAENAMERQAQGNRPSVPPRRPSSSSVGKVAEDFPSSTPNRDSPVTKPTPKPRSFKSRGSREVVRDDQNNDYGGRNEQESPYVSMNNAPASQSRPPIFPRAAP